MHIGESENSNKYQQILLVPGLAAKANDLRYISHYAGMTGRSAAQIADELPPISPVINERRLIQLTDNLR